MDTEKNYKISALNSKDWALSCFRANENFKFITALEQKPQPVSEKFYLFHRYLLWFVKQWFYYSVLRACKLYIDDHYQMATKNVLPFIRNSELCMCYKILFWPAIFQRFFPSSALGPVLRASHIAQEPTGSFPHPSFLPPWVRWGRAAPFWFQPRNLFIWMWRFLTFLFTAETMQHQITPVIFHRILNSSLHVTTFKR